MHLPVIGAVDFALLVTLVLAIVFLHGHRIRRLLGQREDIVRSVGGGGAAAYVFVQLFPEIEISHEQIGDSIHLIILGSFLVLFGLEEKARARSAASPGGSASAFWMHIGLSWAYTWTIIYALPEETAENLLTAAVGSAAIGVHLVYKNYVLHHEHREHSERFDSVSRYVLVLAPVTGWAARMFIEPSEFVFDVFIALLAGALLQNVFQNELPGYRNFDFRWFVAGAAGYSFLVMLSP